LRGMDFFWSFIKGFLRLKQFFATPDILHVLAGSALGLDLDC